MRFTKMHGIGNDYVYVDLFSEKIPLPAPELAIAVSDRHKGIGGDGLILIGPSEHGDARMQMFNADGSESEMCGNGVRCVAKYVHDHGIATKPELKIETGRGVLTLQMLTGPTGKAERIRVNMGTPILKSNDIPTTLPGDPPVNEVLVVKDRAGVDRTLQVTCVSMGNPHCVTFVDELTDDWVLGLGPLVERHAAFPRRVNAEFAQVLSRTEIQLRVWERGSGETQACGTGACATLVAGVLSGRTDHQALIHLPGGDLEIEWLDEKEVFMTGPATEVFSGEWFASIS